MTRDLLAHSAFEGNLVFEHDQPERPPQFDEGVVHFNGRGRDGYETFLFEREGRAGGLPQDSVRGTRHVPRLRHRRVRRADCREGASRREHVERQPLVFAGLDPRPRRLRRGCRHRARLRVDRP